MRNVKEHILFLDIGNSFIKAAYKGDGIEWISESVRFSTVDELMTWIGEETISFDRYVLSSVVEDRAKEMEEALGAEQCVSLSVAQIPTHRLNYETPETLGIDRFLACLGAYSFDQKSVVVIDAGTACTVDFMDDSGIFQGGVIMPGLGILKQALRDHAPALPEVDGDIPDTWPGKSTRASIQWGTAGVFKDAIEAQLNRYAYEAVYITGGDAQSLHTLMNTPTAVDSMLQFKGMEAFLELFID